MTFRGQHLVDQGRSTIPVAKKAHLSGVLSDQGPSWSAPRGGKARGLPVSGTVFSRGFFHAHGPFGSKTLHQSLFCAFAPRDLCGA